MKKLILITLFIVGCSNNERSIPLMYGKVISKDIIDGSYIEGDRIGEHGKLIKGDEIRKENYIIEILNPQGHRLRTHVSEEAYNQIKIGQELNLSN
jgi:hypothetical protein